MLLDSIQLANLSTLRKYSRYAEKAKCALACICATYIIVQHVEVISVALLELNTNIGSE
jgi:hypothetical protein